MLILILSACFSMKKLDPLTFVLSILTTFLFIKKKEPLTLAFPIFIYNKNKTNKQTNNLATYTVRRSPTHVPAPYCPLFGKLKYGHPTVQYTYVLHLYPCSCDIPHHEQCESTCRCHINKTEETFSKTSEAKSWISYCPSTETCLLSQNQQCVDQYFI